MGGSKRHLPSSEGHLIRRFSALSAAAHRWIRAKAAIPVGWGRGCRPRWPSERRQPERDTGPVGDDCVGDHPVSRADLRHQDLSGRNRYRRHLRSGARAAPQSPRRRRRVLEVGHRLERSEWLRGRGARGDRARGRREVGGDARVRLGEAWLPPSFDKRPCCWEPSRAAVQQAGPSRRPAAPSPRWTTLARVAGRSSDDILRATSNSTVRSRVNSALRRLDDTLRAFGDEHPDAKAITCEILDFNVLEGRLPTPDEVEAYLDSKRGGENREAALAMLQVAQEIAAGSVRDATYHAAVASFCLLY